MGYRILDHTADIGIEVHGTTLAVLFSQAAFALVDLLTDRAALTGEADKIIRVEGADLEDLWVNYLREVLYLFNGDNFLIKEIMQINGILPAITIEESEYKSAGVSLEAHFSGEIYNPCRHTIKTEIKAVTYHRAEVKQTPAGWQGVFIVDV
ncbi:MAG: archease [Syntrophales bacterium]